MKDENIIYIGNKPIMTYALAVVTQMKKGNDTVIIKARGKTISRAVDVAEIVRNKFIPNSNVTNIEISTEELQKEDKTTTNVSTIEIHINKEKKINIE